MRRDFQIKVMQNNSAINMIPQYTNLVFTDNALSAADRNMSLSVWLADRTRNSAALSRSLAPDDVRYYRQRRVRNTHTHVVVYAWLYVARRWLATAATARGLPQATSVRRVDDSSRGRSSHILSIWANYAGMTATGVGHVATNLHNADAWWQKLTLELIEKLSQLL